MEDYPSLSEGSPSEREAAAPELVDEPAQPPALVLPSEPVEGERTSSPKTSWPWWTAPLALLGGLLLATVASLFVDLPALAFGVNISSSNTPPGIAIADTFVQDVAFVIAAVYCAQIGGRVVRSWQFGLRSPGAGWVRAAEMIGLLLGAYLLLGWAWTEAFHPKAEELLDQLGTNEGTALLLLSAALTCVIAPMAEEMLFRGFIFTSLRNLRGTLPAALLTGIVFGGVHYGSAPVLDLVPLGILGFGLCLLYRYSGSLYPSMVAHSLNNSIAFAALESWNFLQGGLLLVLSLLGIGALLVGFRRVGLIAPSGVPARSDA